MKKLMYMLSMIAVAAALLIGGFELGKRFSEHRMGVREQYLSVLNSLQAYSAQADIAEALAKNDERKAMCLASVQASAFASVVRTCLESADCRLLIEEDVRRLAPEFFGDRGLRMRQYKPGEVCQ